jgi:hypothetical protein
MKAWENGVHSVKNITTVMEYVTAMSPAEARNIGSFAVPVRDITL